MLTGYSYMGIYVGIAALSILMMAYAELVYATGTRELIYSLLDRVV
jgi:hypothetical protein